jgi:thiol-disulfide isomerase/thioredoxin
MRTRKRLGDNRGISKSLFKVVRVAVVSAALCHPARGEGTSGVNPPAAVPPPLLKEGYTFFETGHRQAAPNLALTSLKGKAVNLSDFKGKVVVLNFWATWCAPCITEIPSLIALQKQYADRGVIMIGASVDKELQPVEQFVAKMQLNYPVVLCDPKAAAGGGIDVFPTTLIIDQQGNLAAIYRGAADGPAFENGILKILAQK